MEAQVPYTRTRSDLEAVKRKVDLDRKFRSGINWFYWIAGLSIINSILYLAGGGITFVVGLGATQVIDGFMGGVAQQLGPNGAIAQGIGLVLNIGVAAVCAAFGYFGRRRSRSVIVTGMVLYGLDALLVLVFGDFFAAIFHVWALIGLFGGLRALTQHEAMENSSTEFPRTI
jgi:hypothetical protein